MSTISEQKDLNVNHNEWSYGELLMTDLIKAEEGDILLTTELKRF
jgi:hypothetical protein